MEVKTITYKRVHNLGNYNTEHLEMVAELGAEDNVNQCANKLKDYVETALGIVNSEPKPATPNFDEKPF